MRYDFVAPRCMMLYVSRILWRGDGATVTPVIRAFRSPTGSSRVSLVPAPTSSFSGLGLRNHAAAILD